MNRSCFHASNSSMDLPGAVPRDEVDPERAIRFAIVVLELDPVHVAIPHLAKDLPVGPFVERFAVNDHARPCRR